ncbi:MmcQ/YjbR family DNA-binding protein [Photobacterium sanguinicancri]|uniref:MmcQ/YjbR family DNA-binding protein n=1 Tax=Photobacterium sanguinicancri TaxID=875932 RepID=UPI0021C29D5A|nr:MmcQ/YjbR family DNA-binding protein [Photobacterium sanguinicancri]
MNKHQIETLLSSFTGSDVSSPFGPDALVYKVKGKMYALVSQNEDIARVTVKCKPEDGEVLVSQFDSISPGYYMNKRHWITIKLCGEVDSTLLTDLAHHSYQLVVAKLKKVERESLLINSD